MEFHDTLYACVCQDAFTYRYVLMKQDQRLFISCYKITATLIYLSPRTVKRAKIQLYSTKEA